MARKTIDEGAALTTIDNAGALAVFDFGQDAGAGMDSMGAADQAIPYLSILQGLSKAVSDPDHMIDGARPGMIMDSVSKTTWDCDKGPGMVFLPCISSGQVFTEWEGAKGKGTPVNRLMPDDPIVVEAKRNYSFNELKAPNGNRLEETFYVSGIILSEDMQPTGYGVISFKSTGIKAYKASIGEIYKVPGNAPLYAFPLRIKTKSEQRAKGTSFNFHIMPNGYEGAKFLEGIVGCVITPSSELGKTLYPLARQLAGDIASGKANIHTEGEGGGAAASSGSEDEPY